MSRKITTEQFVQKAINIHGTLYDYSKVVYINAKTKVKIICPIHGEFEQTPDKHLNGQNCPKCTGTSKYTKIEYVEKANLLHNKKYTYENLKYSGMNEKIIITCQIHGDFSMSASHHINRKQGCPKCKAEKARLTLIEFIKKSKKAHNNKYDYSLVKYIKSIEKVEIICPKHGKFWQIADSHMRGHGCPSCSKSGFDVLKPGILYYLKIVTEKNQVLYKIGITNKSVNERFSLPDLKKIEIIKQKTYDNGQDALDKETEIKRKFREFQYKGQDILQNGNTELFTIDILVADR